MIRHRSGGDVLRGGAALATVALLMGAAPAAPIAPPASAPAAGPAVVTASPALTALTALPDLGPEATVTRLASGGVGIVRPLAGAPVAAVELWYRAPSTGFGAKPSPSLARVAAQVVAASKPLVGVSLGETVRAAGGRLDITVYSDSVSVTAVVPSAAAPAIVKAMTTDYYAPVATQEGFDRAQREVAQEAFFTGFDPQVVVRDAVFSQLFADGPQKYPAEGSTSDIAALDLATVRAFATRAFRAQNSVLVVSGAVDASIVASAVSGRPDPANPGAEVFANAGLAASPGPVTKKFVDASGGYGWVGPPISDTRSATALDFVADYLFRPDAGVVARAVSEGHPDVFVGGQFITLNDPGVMLVVYSGKSPALATTVRTALGDMQTPLDPATFKAAIEAFRGHLESDLQTPRELADNFGWYTVEGNPEYAPGANGASGLYFSTASTLTPEFVADTVKTYLGKAPVAVDLTPDGAASNAPARSPAVAPPAPAPSAPAVLPSSPAVVPSAAPLPGSR